MLCNIVVTDGTNQSHNISDIYNVHLYQSINCLNAPHISYSSVTGSFMITITNFMAEEFLQQAQLLQKDPQNVLCQMKSCQPLHSWQNCTKQLHFRRPA